MKNLLRALILITLIFGGTASYIMSQAGFAASYTTVKDKAMELSQKTPQEVILVSTMMNMYAAQHKTNLGPELNKSGIELSVRQQYTADVIGIKRSVFYQDYGSNGTADVVANWEQNTRTYTYDTPTDSDQLAFEAAVKLVAQDIRQYN